MLLPLAASDLAPRWLAATLDGTFQQIWAGDLKLPLVSLTNRFYIMRLLGCREITIQWVAYGPGTDAYAVPETLITSLLNFAAINSIAIRIGLPYDRRYWDTLEGQDEAALSALLASARDNCLQYLQQSDHAKHAAFAGWYLPYEIEQYSWRRTDRADQLTSFVSAIATASATQTTIPLAVSTFSSKLSTSDVLVSLWERILSHVQVRPMIQDSAGRAGLSAYRALAPLCALCTRRGIPFDLVVELFRDRTTPDAKGFTAVSAEFSRLSDQISLAAETGADRLIGFAVDPYIIGSVPGAAALKLNYETALKARPPDET